MMFMNEHEIEVYLFQFRSGTNLRIGAGVLYRLMYWTNENSDGWAFWPRPARSAKSLMALIYKKDHEGQDCTEAELRKACAPIKAFLTRQDVDHTEVFS